MLFRDFRTACTHYYAENKLRGFYCLIVFFAVFLRIVHGSTTSLILGISFMCWLVVYNKSQHEYYLYSQQNEQTQQRRSPLNLLSMLQELETLKSRSLPTCNTATFSGTITMCIYNQVDACIGRGRRTGHYQACERCSVYHSCFDGTLYPNRPCPAGLVWDDNRKRCDWSSNTCKECPWRLTQVNQSRLQSTAVDRSRRIKRNVDWVAWLNDLLVLKHNSILNCCRPISWTLK